MKDVEKTNVNRQNSRKRMRRRKRNMNIYGLVVLLLVITAGITISYTFLFNINEIRVSGESDMYTAEQIVEASGISEGDNLLRLDPKKAQQQILDKLLYVETASVNRDFPSSLSITVTKCVPAFNVSYNSGILLVSKNGKILADNAAVTEGLTIVYGYEPEDPQPGKTLKSANDHKEKAFSELVSAFGKMEDVSVATIDMSDEYSIVVNYSNGMVFKMGNWSDVEYKLNLANTVMNDDSVKGKKGYLTMVGSNQCSFRLSDAPAEVHDNIEPTTAKTTNENGEVISGESNPEQEAIFDEYNNRGDSTSQSSDTSQDDSYNGDDSSDYSDSQTYDDGSDYYDYNDYSNDYYDDSGYSDGSEW